ncbi:MAG: UvrD-helicase domain-containing protein [Chloroflexi bacterium]|nr:UvrD-helicase domain-containing protein [Chloroflexota bacterium]
MDLLQGLNPAQRQAVEAVDGPVLVIAGPGSGKTRVIVQRIAYLVKTCGVRPYRIIAVTFTNKAARELRERVHRLLGQSVQDLTLGTFHSICARILRIEADDAGLDSSFTIYDAADQTSLLKRTLEDTGIDPKRFSPGALKHAISAAKARLLTPAEFAAIRANYFDEVVLRAYERYEERLRQSNALDFDDLIMKVVRLLEGNDRVREKYQSRYVHVLIDEFQDTNLAQYRLARLLAGGTRNLCVVGDPDQSIYAWRQADVGNILNFEKDYPGAQVIKLEQNYRSTQTILEASSEVIAVNRERKAKELWTENQQGLPITVVDALNEQDEALLVVNEIDRLTKEAGRRFSDCAVMYRTNAQSRPLEEAFVRYGLPYHLVGATRFYERREVKDVLAYLRLINNPFDDVNLLRIVNVPSRGIGQRSLDELARWATGENVPIYTALQLLAQSDDPDEQSRSGPELTARALRSLTAFRELIDSLAEAAKQRTVAELVEHVLTQTGYRDHLLASDDRGEERLENVLELRTVAEGQALFDDENALGEFLESVALVSDADDAGERPDSATLITLHQAKGLEFPVVFIVGMEEGILPHIRSFDDPAQMEEERRLCYVGMTRAREQLYLVRAYRRAAMGMRSANPPSRFLSDVPKRLTVSPRRRGRDAAPTPSRPESGRTATRVGSLVLDQTPAPDLKPAPAPFQAGDRVRHEVFGDGIVVTCGVNGVDHEATVAFRGDVGVKRLLLAYAPLEKV